MTSCVQLGRSLGRLLGMGQLKDLSQEVAIVSSRRSEKKKAQ
jgi:hypothetical protein